MPAAPAVSRSGTPRSSQLKAERAEHDGGSGEKERVKGGGVRRDVRLVNHWWEVLHDCGAFVRARACTPDGRRWASSWASRLVKIAPKMETPMQPPI